MVGTVQESTQEMQGSSLQSEAPAQLYAEDNLIYQIDFENLTTKDIPEAKYLNMDAVDSYGGAYAPDSFDGAYFYLRKDSKPIIESADVNGKSENVLTFAPTANAWHRFYVYPASGKVFPAGNYSVEVLVNSTVKSSYTYTVNCVTDAQYAPTSLEPGWTKLTCEFSVSGNQLGKQTVSYNGTSATGNFMYFSFAAMNHATSWSVDYVKVYYQPVTNNDITVSFAANGKNGVVPDAVTVPAGSVPTLDVSGYSMSDCGTARFAGWATSADGEAVSKIDVTAVHTLYAVWDENYYPSKEEELNTGKLVATMDFNNFFQNDIVSGDRKDLQNYANITGNSATLSGNYSYDCVDATESGTVNHRLFPYFNSGTSNTANDGTLVANKGKDNDLVLVDTRTSAGAQHRLRAGLLCTKSAPAWASEFADGVYTLAAEMMVEENANITKAQVGIYYEFYNTALTAKEYFSDELPVGEKVYVKKQVLIKDGVIYDYDTMKSLTSYDGKVTHLALIVIANNNAATTVKVHVDNFKFYYNPECNTPKAYAENSIRVAEPNGIRFKSSLTKTLKSDAKTTEYGFIVTRSTLLGDKDDDYLTFEQTDVKYVSGVSYGTVNGEHVDKIFSEDTYNLYFTAAITGIKADKGSYMEDLVVRPYIKHDGETIYGSAMRRSVYDVAVALKANGYTDLDEKAIAMVNSILAICE